MQAKFDIGDLAIRVTSSGSNVILSISSKASNSPLLIPLSPTVARAIASTIMGAAADAKLRSPVVKDTDTDD